MGWLFYRQEVSSLKTSECEEGDPLAIDWLEFSKISMNEELTQHLKKKKKMIESSSLH